MNLSYPGNIEITKSCFSGDCMEDKTAKKKILWGIPVQFALGALFHFLYEWTGENFVVGLFFPVNESIFEHLKLVPLPWLIWWAFSGRNIKEKDRWYTACLSSVITALLLMPLSFYFYRYALNVRLDFINILLHLFCSAMGQIVGLHFWKHTKTMKKSISIGIILFLIIAFAVLTIISPKLPLFFDGVSGKFGR